MLRLVDPSNGDWFCHYMLQGLLCSLPEIPGFDLSSWRPEKTYSQIDDSTSCQETFNVPLISDIHLALRYEKGSEVNCIDFMCCINESIASPFEPSYGAPETDAIVLLFCWTVH